MNLKTFERMGMPTQNRCEWRNFLTYIDAYFFNHRIFRPNVVEIGVLNNRQKDFYEKLLGFNHIGIDKEAKYSTPDILGDSRSPETLKKLKEMLNGEPIDLLFIDGSHSMEGVSGDYHTYLPYVKHIIVFHDVVYYERTVRLFWDSLMQASRENGGKTFVEFKSWQPKGLMMGIGMLIFDEGNSEFKGW